MSYSHVREVLFSLVLLVIATIATGILAFVGPFEHDWIAWAGMVLASTAAIGLSTLVSTTQSDSESEFWTNHGATFALAAVVSGFVLSIIFGSIQLDGPNATGEGWATWGSLMIIYVITTLTHYVVAAAEHAKNEPSYLRKVS